MLDLDHWPRLAYTTTCAVVFQYSQQTCVLANVSPFPTSCVLRKLPLLS